MSDLAKVHPLAIGVDFGGTSVKFGVVRGGELIGEIERVLTKDVASPDAMVEAMAAKICDLHERHPEVAAVGVGVPGAVDAEGVTYNLTNVPGWRSIPLRGLLSEKTHLPVTIDNDANCAAVAEWKYGAGKGFTNVVLVTLGTGVGGGLILNNELYRGSNLAAGEIGQMSVDHDGVDGPYGNFGALERYIGHQQISEIARQRFLEAGREVTDAECSPESLAEAANDGDEIAHQVWHVVAEYLGTVLTSIIYLLNPDAIVVGGGVAHAGEVLFEPLRERMRAMLSKEFFERLSILPAELGNPAGIIGSAALAVEPLIDADQR